MCWWVDLIRLTAALLVSNSEIVLTEKQRMQQYQQRVIDEKTEIDARAKALGEFIGRNPVFETIDPEEQERMKFQNGIMWQYSEILGDRIAAFDAQ